MGNESIVDRIAPRDELPKWTKICIYSDPGVGKTVFCAGAPNPLILDCERGTRSLLNHPELQHVPVLQVRSFEDIIEVFWELKDPNSELNKKYNIETVIIDTLSELQRRKLDQQLRAASDKDDNRNPYLPFQSDYKENTESMRRMVIQFTELEKNLIITAHAVEWKDESTGRIYWRPDLTPKLSKTMEGIIDLLGYMTLEIEGMGNNVSGYVRKLQIMPSSRVKAKTRIGGLPPIMTNPTIKSIFDANAKGIKVIETVVKDEEEIEPPEEQEVAVVNE